MLSLFNKYLQIHFIGALAITMAAMTSNPSNAQGMPPAKSGGYGFSRTFGQSVERTYSQTGAKDIFNPNLIPSPVVPRSDAPQAPVPKPKSMDGKTLPKPVFGRINKDTDLQGRKQEPTVPMTLDEIKRLSDRESYGGDKACLTCHKGYNRHPKRNHIALLKAKEKGLPHGLAKGNSCEHCHGPGKRHTQSRLSQDIYSFREKASNSINERCLTCHRQQTGFTSHEFHFSPHNTGNVSCLQCHSEHYVKEPLMLKTKPNHLCLSCHLEIKSHFLRRSHHPLKDDHHFEPLTSSRQDSKLKCVDCHNPHSTRQKKRRLSHGENNACTRCHPSMKGPFFFEHTVDLSETNQCTICHSPHGSHNDNLLLSSGRTLCLSCHSDRVNHNRPQSCYTSGCHSSIHGSNSDLLFRK